MHKPIWKLTAGVLLIGTTLSDGAQLPTADACTLFDSATNMIQAGDFPGAESALLEADRVSPGIPAVWASIIEARKRMGLDTRAEKNAASRVLLGHGGRVRERLRMLLYVRPETLDDAGFEDLLFELVSVAQNFDPENFPSLTRTVVVHARSLNLLKKIELLLSESLRNEQSEEARSTLELLVSAAQKRSEILIEKQNEY